MDREQKNKIINFLNDQISQAEFRARAYVFDDDNKKRPTRNIYVKLNKYVEDFINGDSATRWITLTGLRGSGKTTLVSQLYWNARTADAYKLYISLDYVVQILGITLNDLLAVYEEIIGSFFEKTEKPILLFLDEVQYDEKWGITLKSIYDRSRKVFIFATGSAALTMNTNADVARRTIYEKLYPLCFTEFLKIKNEKFEEKGLVREMRRAIFESQNAKGSFNSIKLLEPGINKYFLGVDRMDIDKYIKYGSLPFMVALKNEALVYDQINKTLDRIINSDVARTGRFGSEIISKIPAILYAVADMDQINYTKISGVFGISRPKVMEIFDVLEKTETLIKIYPYGSHITQSRKPLKYLFSSPAFRSMYYHMIGNIVSADNARGKLLEDTAGMYLKRFLDGKINASLTYDSAQGGADFIVSFGGKRILIEVGAGSKDSRQLLNTAKKVKADYGLAICNDDLELLEENILKMPLKYFLLI
ncbi:MAG: AAA family ATPase [Candidatus Pacebacteria bacterium]|jgi:hypothetical protein|nr:AAA family ATPase [Candidatus Paceibacterota bacterium]